ncbi:uncharacterized protein LOC142950901 [Anarhichas minor]|uniref:uncharacterized protein LOC142950901 n=1 Tax=Anarhichas minor TaxID=65739 RepID=UPI003F739FD2
MDEYQHPLFFEAKYLTDREKEKVRRHFQKKRDSGGGDCGMIEKAEGNTYKICFKEKEDQERVLQRKFHNITLPCGEVSLTVSRTMSPQTTDQPSSSHSQTFTKANTKGLEKIFKLDIFLLYFLRDNQKANKVLQNQLSSIGCTVELDFVEEEAVVRGDIEKDPGGAFGAAEKWKIQVDRVFIDLTESYLCYTVVEQKEIKILLQDLSFVTDDIKVYSESGYVVVVGEVEAVNERISILEKSLPTRKELPIAEKRFKLVEEEFCREMCAHCPKVKIHIGHAMITLDGPDMEVQSGATKLDELIKKVKEKRVKLCPALMDLITSSDVISKYEARFQQSLRSPVSLEAGSDLVLSSLSSDALDEAEAAMQRDLTVDDVPLQGAAAVPPDLNIVKDILNKAKNKANSPELRVDVSFIPEVGGTATAKVRLVGYRENVNKLKEVLHDYQMTQVEAQEMLNLPHPELLDCFHKVLSLIDIKQTKVTLKTSPLPHPCVLVSGPRCLVQETKQNLISALASLMSDTLVLDGPGAQRYFQAEGRVGKELVESSCQVLIREQQSVYSPIVETKPRSISSPSTSSFASSTMSLAPQPISRLRSSTVGSIAANQTSLEIRLGSLLDEQV